MTQNSRFPGEKVVQICYFFVILLVSFVDCFFGFQFWSNSVTFWCQKGPKRSSQGSCWGSFFIIFGIPCESENWALACTGAQFLRSQGVSFALFCDTFWKGCVKTLTGSFPQQFVKDLVRLGKPFGVHLESFLVHFFKFFFCSFAGAPGRPTTTYFGSPGGFKELLS